MTRAPPHLPREPNPTRILRNPLLAFDESAETWIRCQPGLKGPVIFIAEQSRDLPRRGGSFDQLHVLQLSAIGG